MRVVIVSPSSEVAVGEAVVPVLSLVVLKVVVGMDVLDGVLPVDLLETAVVLFIGIVVAILDANFMLVVYPCVVTVVALGLELILEVIIGVVLGFEDV